MGSIKSDFAQLPEDSAAGRPRVIEKTYAALSARGISQPTKPAAAITRRELQSHLQSVVGEILKNELLTDPYWRGYASMTDEEAAIAINSPFAPTGDEIPGLRFPQSHDTGYRTTDGGKGILTAVTDPEAEGPRFDLLLTRMGVMIQDAFVRFRLATPDPALQGRCFKIQSVLGDFDLAISGRTEIRAGEIFDIGNAYATTIPPRVATLLLGIPFAPNAITAEDIAEARK